MMEVRHVRVGVGPSIVDMVMLMAGAESAFTRVFVIVMLVAMLMFVIMFDCLVAMDVLVFTS